MLCQEGFYKQKEAQSYDCPSLAPLGAMLRGWIIEHCELGVKEKQQCRWLGAKML